MMSPRFDFGNLIKHAVIVGENSGFVYIYAAFQFVNVCEVSAILDVVIENSFWRRKKTPNVNRI